MDVPLVVVTLALCVVGLLVLDSVTVHHLGLGPEVVRQMMAMGLGLALMLGVSFVDPSWWGRYSMPLYVVSVVGLVLVRIPGIGHLSHGARRWISLGPLGAFQPAEPAKLALLLLVAWLLTRGDASRTTMARALQTLALALVPAALILLQPDMGTALVLLGTTGVVLIVSGASPVLLLGLATAACAVAPHFMHAYQRDRLLSYLNPDVDPMGRGYNLIQAQVAVGDGQTLGTGLFAGPMSQHGFVPENWTDFIFSAMGEELGFVGCVGVLALYAILVACVLRTAVLAREPFETLLCAGVAAMLFLHVLINVGMVLGLLPATGLPLPFASYGGTAVMTHMAALGLVLGVYRRRWIVREDAWGLGKETMDTTDPRWES